MLILDLDDFTSRQYGREGFLAYSDQLSAQAWKRRDIQVKVVFSNQVMTPAFSSSDLVEADSTLYGRRVENVFRSLYR